MIGHLHRIENAADYDAVDCSEHSTIVDSTSAGTLRAIWRCGPLCPWMLQLHHDHAVQFCESVKHYGSIRADLLL